MLLYAGEIVEERYEIVSLIGDGGYGTVYEAKQLSTGQHVALKLLRVSVDDEAEVRRLRFEREIMLIAKLRHPHIVSLIDSGVLQDGTLYAALEFIDGEDLRAVLKREKRLSLTDAAHIMGQVLEALSVAHDEGVVHRDLKPANIMVTTRGPRRSAVVLDFGIAGIVEEFRDPDDRTLTDEFSFVGTPLYAAPEQIRKEPITPQSDIYAWGLLFLECLIGRPVLRKPTLSDTLMAQLSKEPVPMPVNLQVHPMGSVIRWAVEKKPNERPESAAELLRHLDRVDTRIPLDLSSSVDDEIDPAAPTNEFSRPDTGDQDRPELSDTQNPSTRLTGPSSTTQVTGESDAPKTPPMTMMLLGLVVLAILGVLVAIAL